MNGQRAPRPADDRCPGSLQLVAAWTEYARRAPCPSCGNLTAQVRLSGQMVLAEHRRERAGEALSVGMFA
jgi:hypothetical protein